MKISIATTYYNRKEHLFATLRSIQLSNFNKRDLQVVILDDGSGPEHELKKEDLNHWGIEIKLVRILPEKKTWENPSIPFNICFQHCDGDIIIIQNPESIHVGDVLSHVAENLKPNDYFSFNTFAASPENTQKIFDLEKPTKEAIDKIFEDWGGYGTRRNEEYSLDSWCNHGLHRPKAYHFCSAIHKSDLIDLGGFDPKYADAKSYDDDEFIHRIRLKGMKVIFPEDVKVIHCYHKPASNHEGKPTNYILFHGYTKRKTSHRIDDEETF